MTGKQLLTGSKIGIATLLVVAAIAWTAYSLLRSQAAYDLADKNYAQQQTSSTGPRIKRECAGSSGPSLAKCVDEIIDARNQRDRDQDNLSAQRKVANGTTWFFCAGLIELALTLCGIALLRTQLVATREALWKAGEANRIARDSAHRQLRPYLYLTAVQMAVERYTASIADRAPIALHFKNFGQTPAKHCKFRVKIFLGDMWNEGFDVSFDGEPIIRLGDMPPGFAKDQDGFAITGLKQAADGIMLCVSSIFVCGLIEYDDGGGGSFKSEFRLACTGSDLLKNRFSPTPRGNESD